MLMSDRAQYLARTLISRVATLERLNGDDGKGGPTREQRIALVEKVLAVDVGVTDWKTVSLVESALPHNLDRSRGADREIAAFADFLRAQLAREIAAM